MPPTFVYFDMGNVLLRFSHERMAAQMAAVTGISAQSAWKILFDDELEDSYEHGDLTREQFFARFCEASGAPADIDALELAFNDIFELNAPILGIVGRLANAGYSLGICSNTSLSHWQYCKRRFVALGKAFSVYALSFQLRAMKPEAAFYHAAAKLAQVEPEQIFFFDDRPENVAGAQSAGWDAALFESVTQLNQSLRDRGVLINY